MTAEEEYQKAKEQFEEKVNAAKDYTISELEYPGHIKRSLVMYAPLNSKLNESFSEYLDNIASDIFELIKDKYGKSALSFNRTKLSNTVMFEHCMVEIKSDIDMGLIGPDHDIITDLVLEKLRKEFEDE